MKQKPKVGKGLISSLVFIVALVGSLTTAQADLITYTSPTHTFSIDDVQGGFDGSTYGPVGAIQDPTIICGIDSPCPPEAAQPFVDRNGYTLYPVDSEFGFYVVDFIGGFQKLRDGDYAEGWVGNITGDLGELVGLAVSNAPTDRFKSGGRLGGRCAGLGSGTAVKCETEHYTVMEHVLTCFETIPYFYADPLTGTQALLTDPITGEILGDCADGTLDNSLNIIVDGVVTATILGDSNGDGIPDTPNILGLEPYQMEANESSVINNIALGDNYSLTVKDDGKALYRWGSIVNRPNDLRAYAKLDLPAEWKDNPTTAFPVSKAELRVTHWITNNPNDQLRPEDMENENATGRLPSFIQIGTNGIWASSKDCYEADGDFIPSATLLRNSPFAIDPNDPTADPQAFSADLVAGLTNAWYTTIDRDPFAPDPVSGKGPRWRLTANKFGQDIPGLEIPAIECSEVPFERDNIRYPVGQVITSVLNLLDWEEGAPSPLATSQGWIDATQNVNTVCPDPTTPSCVTVNGLPITTDFDLAVYVKGDQKTTAVLNAQLVIEYEGQGPPATYDVRLARLAVPRNVRSGDTRTLEVDVENLGPDAASGSVTLLGVDPDGITVADFSASFDALAAGTTQTFPFVWTAPVVTSSTTITWGATVTAPGDTNPDNNVRSATTKVVP